MAKPDKLTAEQEAIRNAQNDARVLLPADTQKRIALIYGYSLKIEAEAKAVREAKEEVDAAGTLKLLTGTHGLEKEAITFLQKLAKKDAPFRARVLSQVFGYADDFGWFIRDLFDHNAVGVGSADVAGETAGFDKTTEGKRQAAAGVEQRSVEEMAASNTAATPTPGLDLSTPEARADVERQLEEYLAANPPKRGPVPKERKRLEGLVAEARAIAGGGEAEAATEAEAEFPELPEAKPGEITAALKANNDESAAHIRAQVENVPTAPPVVEAAAEKPKRVRAPKKAATPPAPPAPPPAEAGPSAPPAAEDDEDDSFPEPGAPPHRPDAIGNQPSTFRVG